MPAADTDWSANFTLSSWAADFTLRTYGINGKRNSFCKQCLLHAWAVFHTHAQAINGGPVPPLPPMVLQMLNRSAAQVEVFFGGATMCGETVVPFSKVVPPNWWHNFALTRDPGPEWFAVLPLRMRRVRACGPVTSVAWLASSASLVDLSLSGTSIKSEGLEGLGRIPTL